MKKVKADHKISKYMFDKAIGLGIDVQPTYKEGDLKKLLEIIPSGYYFNEMCLWCGDFRVEMDNYDRYSAVIEMAILIKEDEIKHSNPSH